MPSSNEAPRPPLWRYRYVGGYLAQIRAALAAAQAGRRVRLHWAGPACDLAQLHQQIQRALHRRINLKAGLPEEGGRGRRWDDEYDHRQRSDARAIEDHRRYRRRLRWIDTPEIRRRFAHLIDLDDHELSPRNVGWRVLEGRRAILAKEALHRDARRERRRHLHPRV